MQRETQPLATCLIEPWLKMTATSNVYLLVVTNCLTQATGKEEKEEELQFFEERRGGNGFAEIFK